MVKDGVLTFATAATFAPFETRSADGTFQGFDIDMINALAGSMGLTAKPTDMEFDGLIPALGGKRVDVINSAMYITDERQKKVDFVPYLLIGESLIVPKGNPKNITQVPRDLSGRTIAVTRGAIGERYMNAYNDELRAQGLPPMTIMTLPTNQDAMLAVQSGRADGFDTSTPTGSKILASTGETFSSAATYKNETKIGIAVRKGDTETAAAIQAALKRFVETGEYEKLLAKYQLPATSNIFTSQNASPPSTPGHGG
ncbi:ABC transporter substrate-binding protein [Saccharopolyspora spinosa]|uniref:ABC transporter substrate-binding protein n=1 Tax=Saccharopolyspora spinosa TaxID=60894 RepID=UPI0002379B8F|nr:ABC transporter substrate-binding protein [Saccharopolyspora spinosa]